MADKVLEELRQLQKQLGLKGSVAWGITRTEDEPEVVMKIARPVPPTLCGEPGWKWWKCQSCPRFYNAPERTTTGKCALCQFRMLQRVRG